MKRATYDTGTEGKENRMEVTTKKQNRRKIVIGVLIAVVVLVAAVIAFASSYLVNYAWTQRGRR